MNQPTKDNTQKMIHLGADSLMQQPAAPAE
jgi:hypothetical protein